MLQLRDLRSFLHSDTKHMSLNTTGMSTTLSKEETAQLWDLDCLPHLRTNCRTCTTKSITLSMYCSWRISVVKRTMGICICATTGVTTTSPRELRTWRCTNVKLVQELVPVPVASWNVHQIRDELNLEHFHTHDHRDVHNLDELRHHGTYRCTQRACQRPCPSSTSCNCGSSAVSSTSALENWTPPYRCTAASNFIS